MKKRNVFFAVIAAAGLSLAMSGCMGYNYSNVNDRNETSVTLSENNYKVVKRVSGEVSCHRILGLFGGMSNEYLRNSAISKMYDNAQLTGSQTIVDIHVVKSQRDCIIYSDNYMKATGTVIEFTGPKTTNVNIVK